MLQNIAIYNHDYILVCKITKNMRKNTGWAYDINEYNEFIAKAPGSIFTPHEHCPFLYGPGFVNYRVCTFCLSTFSCSQYHRRRMLIKEMYMTLMTIPLSDTFFRYRINSTMYVLFGINTNNLKSDVSNA
ncbi:hypothetical protein CHS0354_037987 [Potamilus streckersoni]|uniref:Uncharacterized protein n=1 Tax=Potamilus streckersoni TaxID=2493646 RepID=A0AAE0RQF6_9BIVA|nr:hypothetical protein CHS0354_037987 [Potamilus streckersoni]